MTEGEVVTTPEVQTPAPAATPAAGELTAEGRAIAQTIEMAKADPNFAKLPEVKAILESVGKLPKQELTPNVEGEKKEGDNKEENQEESRKSIFNSKNKTVAPEFKTLEEQQAFIKEKFGTEPSKFYGSVEQWRNDSQELPKYREQAENLTKLIQDEIPDALYNGIQAWAKGERWEDAVKQSIPQFDFSKSFEKQTSEIVNYFFPDQFSEDDLKNTADPIVSKAISVAKANFELKKNEVEAARASAISRADKQAEVIKNSALSSVAALQKEFPDFDEKEIKEVSKIMVGGSVNSLLYKKDGTFRPEAAKRIALMLYGEGEVAGKQKGKAKSEADNKALMNLLDRGSDRPKNPAFQADVTQIPQEINKLLANVNRKPTY